MMFPKPATWRSEKHRRNVAKLDCVVCGRSGLTQVAHANFGKGMGCKASDAMVFAACVHCHQYHDQGGLDRDKRRRLEVIYVDRTRAELIARSLWTPDVEAAYRAAYEPMKQAVE
ncbi:hypothetical protein CAL14_05480 [Bordetella genomosp. 9]|uniref:DUF968 domain-containing protein n=1 Tax=Bordetella genomosp. 9 TaxID=1416803 RepID=UPI000A291F4B|nr:hypothetical protein [Bordetella genomosp. 9]ARP89806.1 hypothetical protein CAL14_05480 [Bordetella genomosp. 9]